MDWDADHPDSLGQLERLLVVLGMRVGSRSQVIWGVILLSFNTYRVRRRWTDQSHGVVATLSWDEN